MCERISDNKVRVLSVQSRSMGHGTYARMMRQHFTSSSTLSLKSLWLNQDRELISRMICRLLHLSLPSRWVAARNLDMRRFRSELGSSYLGRRLVLRNKHQSPYEVLHFHTQAAALLAHDLMQQTPTVISGDMTAVQVAQDSTTTGFQYTYAPSVYLEKRVFETARSVVLWSEWAAKSVREDYRIGAEKVHVVYPGVDLASFPFTKKTMSDKEKPVKLLFVGSDFTRKGGDDLLNVFLNVLPPPTELHLVTNASIACSHPRVHFHRDIEAYSARWCELYQQSDIFVLPTRQEAFGLVFLEAMAAGLPVVATKIAAIPEIVQDRKTGLLIQPGDTESLASRLLTLIGDRRLRRDMGCCGRAVVEQRFEVCHNFEKLGKIFQDAKDMR